MAEFLIIGGSGAYFLEKELFGKVLKKQQIDTPFGLSSPIYTLQHEDGFEFLFLSRHGEKDYDITAPFVNYRANIYAAKFLGVKRIVSWTGPGSLKEEMVPGDYVVPHDILDFTKNRKSTFFENGGLGFVRQSPVFCPQTRKAIIKALEDLKLRFHSEGVYICTEGPRLETPAEIRAFKMLGGELVGMTLSPEVFLAKELELCYASICYVTNYAEGIKELPFKTGILFEGMLPEEQKALVDNAVSRFPDIVKRVLFYLRREQRQCSCGRLMERYRKKGKAGKDWQKWIFNL